MPLVGDRQRLALNGEHWVELESPTRNLQHLGFVERLWTGHIA